MTVELYQPRTLHDLGNWDISPLTLKVYAIQAPETTLDPTFIEDARAMALGILPSLAADEGNSNNLGFVSLHVGTAGITVLLNWWSQGCVLCRHYHRISWAPETRSNAANRPVVGCVWELGLIGAEQEAWRRTMMVDPADPAAYLASRFAGASV